MSSVVIKVKTNSASPGREGGLIEDLRCMMLVSSFIFLFVHFENIGEQSERAHYYPLVLAVNKSCAVYILSAALDGLWRENKGSVNRLILTHLLLEILPKNAF